MEHAKELGSTFCLPHQYLTDAHLDRQARRLDSFLLEYLTYVRELEMLPGLSTHTPEAVVFADRSEADLETYLQIYNSLGFLCQVETDWVQRVIHRARRPVIVIKPLAGGRLPPATGLPFVWNTIRDRDLVALGTLSAYEAEESIELSLACLERRLPQVPLQVTRSKTDIREAAQ